MIRTNNLSTKEDNQATSATTPSRKVIGAQSS
jgi:hypothetical protein